MRSKSISILTVLFVAALSVGALLLLTPSRTGIGTNDLLLSASCPGGSIVGMQNPAAVYCAGLGYDFGTVKDPDGSETGMCNLPDGSACDSWEFLAGKCGKEYSYCARQGLELEVRTDGQNMFSQEYAVCVNTPENRGKSEEIVVTDLLDLGRGKDSASSILKTVAVAAPVSAGGDGGAAGGRRGGTRSATHPTSFDWRDVNGSDWVSPVKDQASCGSCWSFAAVGGVEAKINIARNDSNFDADLSEEYMVSNCSDAGSCNGGHSDHALEFVRDEGISDEVCFPYNFTPWHISQCSWRCQDWERRLWNIDDSGYVLHGGDAAIKEALIEKGPLPTHMLWFTVMTADANGAAHCSGDIAGGHAIVLVGYNDTGGYWILKNSWGAGWNGDGYFKVAYGECFMHYSSSPYYIDLEDHADNVLYAENLSIPVGNSSGALNATYTKDGMYLTVSEDCFNGTCNGLDARFNFTTGTLSEATDSVRILAYHQAPIVANSVLQFWNASAGSWANATFVPAGSFELIGYDICNSRRECQDYLSADNISLRYYYNPEDGVTDNVYIDFLSIESTSESGYCSAEPASAQQEHISRLDMNGAQKDSENSTYSDFTSTTLVTLQRSSNYTLSVTVNSSHNASEFLKAWIDYDNDQSFDSGELIDFGSATFLGAHNFSANFTVPYNATNAYTRMRVFLNYNNAPTTSCEYTSFGEVEDYLVRIVPGPCACGTLTRDCMLTGDLESNGTCITLGAGSILLDCDNYEISGNGSGYGIKSVGVDGITVQNCEISGFDTGILLNNTDASRLHKNTLEDNNHGIYLINSANNNVTATAFDSNDGVGIYFAQGSAGNLVENSTFSWNDLLDINLSGASSATILNSTFDKSSVGFGDASSSLAVKWYLRVNVASHTGSAIVRANVTVADNSSTVILTDNTTNDGKTAWHIVTEYVQNQLGKLNVTPHNISVQKNLLQGLGTSLERSTASHTIVESTTVTVHLQMPGIMLVDEDLGEAFHAQYAATLSELNRSFDYWDTNILDTPSYDNLKGYDILVWETGMEVTYALTDDGRAALEEYLDSGGSLFISGGEIGYGLVHSEIDPEFYANYLRSQYLGDDSDIDYVSGYDGDPVSDGWSLTLTGGDGAGNNLWPDIIAPINGSVAIANYTGANNISAIRYVGAYRLVYFAFPFEAIYNSTQRQTVMNDTLAWLALDPPNCACGNLTHDCVMVDDLSTTGLACITIGADNVTLDCAGHTISGTAGISETGIDSVGRSGITIRNCNISTFSKGISASSMLYGNITGNNVSNCSRGIYLSESDNNVISENNVSGNSNYGIHLSKSDSNTLTRNTASDSDYMGIDLYDSEYNTLTGNAAHYNAKAGINLVYYSDYNNLSGNTADHNGENGIWLVFGSSNNNLSENNASNNGGSGLEFLYWSNENRIVSNDFSSNNGSGIQFYASDENYLRENTIAGNSVCGIYARQNSHENVFEGFTISGSPVQLNLTTNSTLTVLNTTSFNESSVAFGDSLSTLSVQWYLQVNVTNETLAPVNQANVTVADSTAAFAWTDNTSAAGLTGWHAVTEYVLNQSARFNHTPHSISAKKPGIGANYSAQVSVEESKTVQVVLDTTAPTISILSPQNATYTTQTIALTFWASEALSWVAYSLDNGANVTITGNTTIEPANGAHNIILYGNDSYGNYGKSNLTYFRRSYTPPQDDGDGRSGSSGSAASSAVSGNRETQMFSLVKIGEENEFIPKTDMGFTKLVFVSNNQRTNVIINAEVFDEQPEDVNTTPKDALVYKFLEITKINIWDFDMDFATIEFSISREWVEDNNIDLSTITLYHLDDGEWVELDTEMVEADSETYYFMATTPSFSFFAIAGMVVAEEEEAAVPTVVECGDGTCEAEENCTSCPADCGECEAPVTVVAEDENVTAPADVCGDHFCSDSESCLSCPTDCGDCGMTAAIADWGRMLYRVLTVVLLLAAGGLAIVLRKTAKKNAKGKSQHHHHKKPQTKED